MKKFAALVAMIVVLVASDTAQAGPLRNWFKSRRPGIVFQKSASATGSCGAAGCSTLQAPPVILKK